MTASAWLRSIRPFRKARFVNSPGSAWRAPAAISSDKVRDSGTMSAVTVDLHDILARIGSGRAHDTHQHFVNDLSRTGIDDMAEMKPVRELSNAEVLSVARLEDPDAMSHGIIAAQPDNADAAFSRRRRDPQIVSCSCMSAYITITGNG